jgi:hypothetical protein
MDMIGVFDTSPREIDEVRCRPNLKMNKLFLIDVSFDE